MLKTMNPKKGELLRLLLLLLSLSHVIHGQDMVDEGSGTTTTDAITTDAITTAAITTETPTTQAPCITNSKVFSFAYGDIDEFKVATTRTVKELRVDLPLPIYVNSKKYTTLIVATSGTVADRASNLNYNSPKCTGVTNTASSKKPELILASLWTKLINGRESTSAKLYVRISSSESAQKIALRKTDFQKAVTIGLAKTTDEIIWMLVSTLLIETKNRNECQKNIYVQTVLIALRPFSFIQYVEYNSVDLDTTSKIFIGQCQGSSLTNNIILSPNVQIILTKGTGTVTEMMSNAVDQTSIDIFVKGSSCLSFVYKQKDKVRGNQRRVEFACPCSLIQALLDPRILTFHLFKYNDQNYLFISMIFFRRINFCSFSIVAPFFLIPEISFSIDSLADISSRDDCITSKQNRLFQSVRPALSCFTYRAPIMGFGLGDPHFQTLDGLQLTFNGVGLYVFIVHEETRCDIKLTRLERASVVSGIACTVNGTGTVTFDIDRQGKFRVNLRMGTNDAVIVLGPDGESKLNDFGQYEEFGITITKDTKKDDTLLAKFDNGNIALAVTVVKTEVGIIIQQGLTVDKSLNGTVTPTMGILGTFNGNKDDDLMLSTGDLISTSSTEQQIFNQFGKKWETGIAGSPTIYNTHDNSQLTFASNFIPAFCDELTPTQEVITACDGNKNCECDASIVNSTSFGALTTKSTETVVAQIEELGNSPPSIVTDEAIFVTVGEPFKMNVTAVDPDGDEVTINATQLPTASTFLNGVFEWTPADYNPATLAFLPTDITGKNGSIFEVTIKVCDCTGKGQCLPDILKNGSLEGDKFQVVICSCIEGVIGDHCDMEDDKCCADCLFECFDSASCVNLGYLEEEVLSRNVNCTKCNEGYEVINGECDDIDECLTLSTCTANSECINSDGSFTCPCLTGYMSDSELCKDIDECRAMTHNCEQTCDNNEGAYTCSCIAGYELNNDVCEISPTAMTVCTDDPCDDISTTCGLDQNDALECICNSGYEPNPTSTTNCLAIDECTTTISKNQHVCRPPATCVNSVDSYSCTCDPGTILAIDLRGCDNCSDTSWGVNCTGMCNCGQDALCDPESGCTACRPGLTGQSCETDINECLTANICTANSQCADTTGSYTCTCDDDYLKQANNTCMAINKCETFDSNPCMNSGRCIQDVTTYTCTCVNGYEGTKCEIDPDVCGIKIGANCQNDGTCMEGLGDTYSCNCTMYYKGDNCQVEIPKPAMTTMLTPDTVHGTIRIGTDNLPPESDVEAYNEFISNLTQALEEAIAAKLNVNITVMIFRISPDGHAIFTVIDQGKNNITAQKYAEAILEAVKDGQLKTSGFTVIEGSVRIGGLIPSEAPSKPNTIIPAVLGAVLAAAFIIILTILITFISRRVVHKAAVQKTAMHMYSRNNIGAGLNPGQAGRIRWLPKAWVSGRTLAHVRPRARPQNNPWAIDPYEPEVDPSDVNWQQWRGHDNFYYNRTKGGAQNLGSVPVPIAARAQAPFPMRRGPNNMMFRNIQGLKPPPLPSHPVVGLRRTRIPPFVRRTLRAIPSFFQRAQRQPAPPGAIPVSRPHPGLPYVIPGPATFPQPGSPPPPMRMRLSGRTGMPGSGMGNGAFTTAPMPVQFAWGTRT